MRDHAVDIRFTPAYAGKMRGPSSRLSVIQVHPRIRGEDKKAHDSGNIPEGSPPHTRGRSFPVLILAPLRGFTPAYAGKILAGDVPACFSGVHPRIRGEDFSTLILRHLRTGSPPHTRGRSEIPQISPVLSGFTPAYAGKI